MAERVWSEKDLVRRANLAGIERRQGICWRHRLGNGDWQAGAGGMPQIGPAQLPVRIGKFCGLLFVIRDAYEGAQNPGGVFTEDLRLNPYSAVIGHFFSSAHLPVRSRSAEASAESNEHNGRYWLSLSSCRCPLGTAGRAFRRVASLLLDGPIQGVGPYCPARRREDGDTKSRLRLPRRRQHRCRGPRQHHVIVGFIHGASARRQSLGERSALSTTRWVKSSADAQVRRDARALSVVPLANSMFPV